MWPYLLCCSHGGSCACPPRGTSPPPSTPSRLLTGSRRRVGFGSPLLRHSWKCSLSGSCWRGSGPCKFIANFVSCYHIASFWTGQENNRLKILLTFYYQNVLHGWCGCSMFNGIILRFLTGFGRSFQIAKLCWGSYYYIFLLLFCHVKGPLTEMNKTQYFRVNWAWRSSVSVTSTLRRANTWTSSFRRSRAKSTPSRWTTKSRP